MLRKHQVEMAEIIDRIIAGVPIKNIIVKAVPGAGKSSLPIVAGRLITAGLADAICWICPRMSLQDQAERNFIDPFFRDLLNHRLQIRSSTNEVNPCRGLSGFVTTYQAIGADKYQTVLSDFYQKRYILILDEVHHAEAEDGAWTKALIPLYERAAYRVLMSGSMFRGDDRPIAFVNDGTESAHVEYGRKIALSERAILPLTFILSDGVAEWEEKGGRVLSADISTREEKKDRYALYTALQTGFAKDLLTACVEHWKDFRSRKGHGSLLVVAANISSAKDYTKFLLGMGYRARIATSDDTPDALEAIAEFKAGRLKVLVSVAMASEGLDVPSITHIACLTNIRSLAWLLQMVGRAVRVDPLAGPYETQEAFVFAPKDRMFMEVKAQIEADQHWAKLMIDPPGKRSAPILALDGQADLFGNAPGGITPISSAMTGRREVAMNHLPVSNEIARTASEIEADLLDQIERHIRTYSFNNRWSPKRLNSEIYKTFGKGRREMTIGELEACWAHVRQAYPMEYRRGAGKRVETKAKPFPCEWTE